EGGEGGGAAEAVDLGLRGGPLEVLRADDGGEVEEGAGGGGDEDAVVGGDLVGREPSFVDLEPGARPQGARNRDLDGCAVASPEHPEGGGRAVGEHRAVGDEDRGHPGGFARARAVADRVHAAMDRVEAPGVNPMADRPPPEAELDE